MEFKFVNSKLDSSYVTLLSKITFKYCDNHDGKIYTTYKVSDTHSNLIELLINELTPLVINKKNTIILNLLVNPFFDELCNYLFSNPNISKSKIGIIKKYIFLYLSDENTKRIFSDLDVEGAELYINKNMYEKSKKMLQII